MDGSAGIEILQWCRYLQIVVQLQFLFSCGNVRD